MNFDRPENAKAANGRTAPIAVVGVSALFPGAADIAAFWRDILEGRDRLSDVPRTHWLSGDYFDPKPGTPDKIPSTRGGFLPPVDFSPLEFGLPPNIAQATDTAQLLSLIVAKRALYEATRGRFESMNRSRMSVVLGVASATELVGHMSGRLQIPVAERAMRAAGLDDAEVLRVRTILEGCYVPWQESTFPGLLGNVVAGRIANRLDLGGTNAVVDAACASSLAAIDIGINELTLGRSDLVLTGGVDTLNDILMFMCFGQTGALSPTGDCRPFSDDADGTMLGEGIGIVALKRLADAERDGDPIYAVIRGVGTSSDGRAKSIYAPAPEGQALALTRAYERAGYGPETVELVEAHGTATKAGDAAEVEALKAVFTKAGARPNSCALGSVKAQIGHTKAAAGSAGLIKIVMALHHKVLPGTFKVSAPNGSFVSEGNPFYLNTEVRPWIHAIDGPRRASVSALGFGGTNFHVAVEEYRGPAPRPARLRVSPTELVLLSGTDGRAISARCRAEAKGLDAAASGTLVHFARRSQTEFDCKAPARLAIVAASEAELRDKLVAAAEAIDKDDGAPFSTPRGIHFGSGPSTGSVAFLFPGQGSQYVGMGRDLAIHFDCVRAEWDRTAAVATGTERRISDVVFPPPVFGDGAKKRLDEELTRTEWAQPAIAAASLAMLRILERLELSPACVGGHSLGEVTALGASGMIDRDATVAVARRRGEFVARAAAETHGSMSAVLADLPTVRRLVKEWGIDVVVANHNAPSQVVLSGSTAAIEDAERRLRGASLEARRLPVSTAFHSPVVQAACAPFRAFVDGVTTGAGRVPVYSNRTAAPHSSASVRDEVARAIAEPVLFVEQIEAMYAAGARVFVEIGPSAVLTKLVDRCLAGRPHVAIELDARGKHGVTALWDALARLSVAGVALAFGALWEGDALPADPALAPKPKLTLRLTGANYNKPSPPDAVAPRPKRPAPPSPSVATPEPAPMRVAPPPPVHAEPPPAGPIAPSIHTSVIAAHMEYQRLMAESHTAFLRAIAAPSGGFAIAPAFEAPVVRTAIPFALPSATVVQNAAERMAPPPPLARPAAPLAPTTTLGDTSRAVNGAAPSAPAAPAMDLVALMLGIVAEKTGYPAEMIEPGMDLESDLGIDSIKRVEILSAVRTRAPSLPEIDTARMARMRTLQEIVAYFDAESATAAPIGSSLASAPLETSAPAVDLVALMLGIVAEKTGYPAEMIELGMDLESDLGIDSIKRVEILSAVRTRAPSLPEIDTARMARMRTLQEIVAYFGGSAAAPANGSNGAHHHDGPRGAPKANGHALPTSASTPRAPSPARRGAIGRLATRAVPSEARGLAVHGLFGAGEVAVTSDGAGVATALVARLRERGVPARAVDAVPGDAGAVVFLGGLRPVATIDDALSVNREAFASARAVAARFRESGGAFVTVQDTGGDFGLDGRSGDRAWLAGLGALAKTAAEEWPAATARAIDIERGGRDDDAIAAAIANELLFGGSECEVGLRASGARTAIVGVPAPPLGGGRPVSEGAVFVASGGARGVTAAALVALAREARPRLLLLGRSPLTEEPDAYHGVIGDAQLKQVALADAKHAGAAPTPKDIARRVSAIVSSREVRETLRQIEEAGGAVRYAAVDVRDRAALDRVLADVRRSWGPIQGLVHGAGVLSDAFIDKKTDAQFDGVWDTKILGLRALIDATAGDPLEWICLFSSIAARAGNAGQADYAMANEVLNKVAAVEARRRGDACRVVSIGWGPWDGGMVTPALRTHFEARGVKLLAVDAGARAFVAELGGRGDVEIGIGGDAEVDLKSRPRRLEADVLVNESTWPQLASHCIKGNVVLPMAVVLEWFARLSQPFCNNPGLVEFRELRVVRGVPLAGYFSSAGDRFHVIALPSADGASVALELRDDQGKLRYAASLDCAPAAYAGVAQAAAADRELASSPWKTAELYGPTTLFHGTHFQVLRSIDGISATHARATLAGTRDTGWSGEWHCEPAAIDGALQLALLFGLHGGLGPSLPMRIERVIYRTDRDHGLFHCELTERRRTREGLLCDLSLTDAGGAPVLDLLGVEMFVVPSGTTAS